MNYLILTSFISMFLLGFGDNLRGPIFPEIIKDFHLSDTEASWYFALSSLMAFFGSYWIRKYKTTYHLSHFLNLGVLFIGLAFLFKGITLYTPVLMVGVIFFGLSMGLLGVCQNNLTVYATNDSNRSKTLSFLHSMYGLSALLSPMYIAVLSPIPWQKIVVYFSFIPILFFIFNYFKIEKNKELFLKQVIHDQEDHTVTSLNLKDKMICFVISFYVLTEIMLGSRLALFMRRYFDFTLEQSSLVVTALFVFLLLGRLFYSLRPPKIAIKVQLLGSLVLSFALIMLGVFVHPYFFVVTGFTMAPFYPMAISFISELNPKYASKIVTMTIAIQAIFIVSMHLIVGKLTDLYDLKIAFMVGPLCLIIAFVLLLGIKVTPKSEKLGEV